MIGIYSDSFLDLLKETVGDPIKITNKQIVCRCPWCEYNDEKDHYHLYISLEAPVFNCFHCPDENPSKGIISKLITKLYGSDISDKYVDKTKIKDLLNTKIKLRNTIKNKTKIQIPPLNPSKYPNKVMYLRSRLKYSDIQLNSIKGLILDIQWFINNNDIEMNDTLVRIQQFLESNFIGFVTENNKMVILRNIDSKSTFRYFKIKVEDTPFLDYYKINGINPRSNSIVLAEGIFDIYSEYIFDNVGIKKDVLLYATANSKKYHVLLKSIIFNESIFRPDVHILSDRGISLNEYRKLAYFNKHIINSLTIYHNKLGKDFNDVPCIIEKNLIK